jgi:flagella basal body P-ring formation protein FlgA
MSIFNSRTNIRITQAPVTLVYSFPKELTLQREQELGPDWPTMSVHKRESVMKWSRMLLTLVLAFNTTACVLLKTDERIDVMVAKTDLGAGRKITDSDITITSMPVSRLTQDMPRKSSQVVGYTTTVPISKGELILLSKVK